MSLENTKPRDPKDPTQADNNSFDNLPHAGNTLAGMLRDKSGSDIKLMAQMAGHPMLNFPSAEEAIAKHEMQQKLKKQGPRKAKAGDTMFHTKRGTKVTIIQASCDTNPMGEELHLVIESQTGKKIKALAKYLTTKF